MADVVGYTSGASTLVNTTPEVLQSPARTLEEQKERERTRINDWLSTYDFAARHLDLQSLRLTGTFEWFLRECQIYREWRTGTLRLLWLEGRSKY